MGIQAGANFQGIDKLIVDIYDFSDKVNRTLNQILDVMDSTESFYVSTEANRLRKKFKSFSSNFKIINKNIISYADDFIMLKSRYTRTDENVSAELNKKRTQVERENK